MQTESLNNPPFTKEEFEKLLKMVYADARKDPGFRAMAFEFISNFSPSERDENWVKAVEKFIFGGGKVEVKTFEPSNSPPINGHRSRGTQRAQKH